MTVRHKKHCIILGSLGRDNDSFLAALGAMATHSGQPWVRWRLILGSLGRDGEDSCWELPRVILKSITCNRT